MKVIVAPDARRDLEGQLIYLIEHDAVAAARRLEQRVVTFVERILWEVWIPGTRIILWYRFTREELQIVRVWHSSQDRAG